LLSTALPVERAKHVVLRDEIDVVLVGRGDADDVAADSPAPVDAAVAGHQTVEEVILGADVDAIVEREDLIRRPAQSSLPQWGAVHHVQGHDAPILR